jgi:hypothetical protein
VDTRPAERFQGCVGHSARAFNESPGVADLGWLIDPRRAPGTSAGSTSRAYFATRRAGSQRLRTLASQRCRTPREERRLARGSGSEEGGSSYHDRHGRAIPVRLIQTSTYVLPLPTPTDHDGFGEAIAASDLVGSLTAHAEHCRQVTGAEESASTIRRISTDSGTEGKIRQACPGMTPT